MQNMKLRPDTKNDAKILKATTFAIANLKEQWLYRGAMNKYNFVLGKLKKKVRYANIIFADYKRKYNH